MTSDKYEHLTAEAWGAWHLLREHETHKGAPLTQTEVLTHSRMTSQETFTMLQDAGLIHPNEDGTYETNPKD